MKSFFKELFDYNQHCNQHLATVFTNCSAQTSEKAVKLFSHILNAHHIWTNRITTKPVLFSVWQIHPAHHFKTIGEENYQHSLHILEQLDLEQTITYTISTGQAFQNSIRDILFHIINHSTYHRAQIATEFKQNGLPPLATDYIFYKR